MTESSSTAPPSPFIARWIERLAAEGGTGRALDVAAGRGRHARAMASAGFRVVAIDIQLDALRQARESCAALLPLCADLTRYPLPPSRFDLIVCTRYLDRALFPALRRALAPGGVLLYETFTEQQLRHGRGPRSPEHLLRSGELRELAGDLEILFEEEVTEPDALARIAARRT